MECIGMDTTSVVVEEYDQKVSSGASFGEGIHLWLNHGRINNSWFTMLLMILFGVLQHQLKKLFFFLLKSELGECKVLESH
jgi:hypothetical protein